MSEQNVADALAEAAVSRVVSGMTIGLGAGATAARGVRALADKVRDEKLAIKCVAASEAAESIARELGLEILEFALVEELDLLIDGADEVDRTLNVMKGSRGAMTRERMLAWTCRHTVYMVGEQKVSEQIGAKNSLAVAVMAFGLASIRAALRDHGLNGVCRREMNGDLFVTDNGNLILDLSLRGDEKLPELGAALNDIPGVVDHGLFLSEADEILIESERGAVECLLREEP